MSAQYWFQARRALATDRAPLLLLLFGERHGGLYASLRDRRMLGLVYEPEEGSCRSCSSIVQAGAVRRRRCRDSGRVARRETRDCATQLIHRRSRRLSPSCAPLAMAPMAA